MSMTRCHSCDRHIDSDDDPECFVEFEEPRALHDYDVMCETCRNEALEKIEREAFQAGVCEDAAERAGALS